MAMLNFDNNLYTTTQHNLNNTYANNLNSQSKNYAFMDSWIKPKPFRNQDYYKMKSKTKELFEDPLFPASSQSIGLKYLKTNKHIFPNGIKWLRPHQARSNAQFVVNGFEKFHLDQGLLGNCWFISALYSVSQIPKLFARIVPFDDNNNEYNGMFHFRFFVDKEWVDVVIDDRLPFLPDGRFVFCSHRGKPNEFWGALLEKAYAKVFGSYENLEANIPGTALRSLTGIEVDTLNIFKSIQPYGIKTNLLWNHLLMKYNKLPIMTCTINGDPSSLYREQRQANGLLKGHAYSITNFAVIETNINLIKIRDPWGGRHIWNGAWSRNSREWSYVSDYKKKQLGIDKMVEGEFWISFNDFVKHFNYIQMCHS